MGGLRPARSFLGVRPCRVLYRGTRRTCAVVEDLDPVWWEEKHTVASANLRSIREALKRMWWNLCRLSGGTRKSGSEAGRCASGVKGV